MTFRNPIRPRRRVLDPVSQQPMDDMDTNDERGAAAEATVKDALEQTGHTPVEPTHEPHTRHELKLPRVREHMNTVIEPDNRIISVNHCPACNGHHHRIEYRPMAQTLGLFNHYFTCPETGEPVPVSIVAFEDKTLEIPQFVAAAVIRALLTGKWWFFVSRIEDGKIEWERMCHDYPKGDIPKLVDLFAADSRKEVDPMGDKQIQVAKAPPSDIMSLFKARHG
jgi:hypothetical protein